METSSDFVSFKKVLVFGSEGAGKTSLTKKFENEALEIESHTQQSKSN